MRPLLQTGGLVIGKNLRVNERIRVREVRVIDENNNQLGIMQTREAQTMARERGLDLVEVAPTAVPPVCRMMDYGKFRYDQDKRDREARKTQKITTIKEVRLSPIMDDHDIDVKTNMVHRFLEQGYKVKLTVQFKGRQITHQELGRQVLDRMSEHLREVGTPEQLSKMEGRNMTMVFAPRADRARTTPRPPREQPATGQPGASDDALTAGSTAMADALNAAGASQLVGGEQPTGGGQPAEAEQQPEVEQQPAEAEQQPKAEQQPEAEQQSVS